MFLSVLVSKSDGMFGFGRLQGLTPRFVTFVSVYKHDQ